LGATVVAGVVTANDARAETVLRFSVTTGGGIVGTGNSLGLSKELDLNGPGTEDSVGTFMTLVPGTIDDFPANAANPWFGDTTFDWTLNGSDAELLIPHSDTEILYAELVWGGSWAYGSENVSANLDDSIVLSSDGDSIDVAPDPATALTLAEVAMEGFAINYYLRSADVTDFVAEHIDGFYAAEGIPATQDSLIDELNAAGWSLIVVYRSSAEPIRNMTVFVGGEFVDEQSVVDYAVDGFCTPPSGAFDGYATISALEGDADRVGDSLTIAPTAMDAFVALEGPNNPQDNFFCSQINDFDGALDTAGTYGDNNHDAIAGNNIVAGRQGWDVTTVPMSSASGHLVAGQTSAILRAETTGDSFLPTAAGFAIAVNAPDLTGADTGVTPGVLAIDETATITVEMENGGLVDATGLSFSVDVPEGLSVDGFSINGTDGDINGAAVATADLINGVDVGDVLVGDGLSIEFVVRAEGAPANGTDWDLIPVWDYNYISCAGEPALTESHFAPALNIEFDEEDGVADTGGLDDTAGDDSASAEQGGEEDDGDGDAGDSSGTAGDGGGTGIVSGSAGSGGGADNGCGCRSTRQAPLWSFGLLGLAGLLRRRRRADDSLES